MTLQELLSDKEIIVDPNRNGDVRTETISPGSRKRLWWLCRRGHTWEAPVYSIKAGFGCPYCSGNLAIPGETDLATVRPDILKEWDLEKNIVKPTQILPSAHDQVWWRCELGHSWQAMVFSRTREKQARCPYCTGRKVLTGFNDLGTVKPKIAAEWYQPLNGELRPEDVTMGSNKKVWWRCGEGHVWQAAIYSRTRKRSAGCPVCTGVVKAQRTIGETHLSTKKAKSRKTNQNVTTSLNT